MKKKELPLKDHPSFFSQIWPPLPVWRRLDAAVIVVVAYSFIVKLVTQHPDVNVPPGWIGDISVVNGILLGVLLGFRNLQAYDRWWEGRKLWGQLINDTRNLCVKAKTFAAVGDAELQAFGRLVVGFAVGLRNHLRGGRPLYEVPGFAEEKSNPPHVPLYLAEQVYRTLRDWRTAGHLTEISLLVIDPHAKALMDVSGACERIRSSPVPLSYRALLRHGTILYLLSAPWFMAEQYGYVGIALVGLLAYFLLGIELTAEDVEEPFGKDGDDLELTRFCEKIRDGVEQVVGDLGLGDGALGTFAVPKV